MWWQQFDEENLSAAAVTYCCFKRAFSVISGRNYFHETPTGKMETSGEAQARPLRPHLVLDPVTAKVDPSEGVGSGVGSPFRPAPTRVTDDRYQT